MYADSFVTGNIRPFHLQVDMMTKILVIEDEEELRAAIRRILVMNGYAVCCARDGRSALAQIKEEPADLILTDIFMPGMEGLETIRMFTARFPDIPVVVMTGTLDNLFIELGLRFGAVCALNKPFDTDELLRVIEQSLNGDIRGITLPSLPDPGGQITRTAK